MKRLPDLDLEGRKVLLRLDLNVPIDDGNVRSDARISAALPTIRHCLEHGAHLSICSHLGRPDGTRNAADSLEPVGQRLCELLDMEVVLADDCIGDGVKRLVLDQRGRNLLLLENLRFHRGETDNAPEFARQLAAPFAVFVNDAFGACHRAHASIVGVVPHMQDKAPGFLIEAEMKALTRLLERPERPFVAIVGGAKVSDKLAVLRSLLGRVDCLCVGGAMAYTFLAAAGVVIGKSLVEPAQLGNARSLLAWARERSVPVLLPVDHVVEGGAIAGVLGADDVGCDIGPQTRAVIAERVAGARSVFWNGPLGKFEHAPFAAGTHAVAEALVGVRAYSVVGGGDSIAALGARAAHISHVSTGGGASLEFLERGSLPGIDALR
jgi:phosphoglycerate kinase